MRDTQRSICRVLIVSTLAGLVAARASSAEPSVTAVDSIGMTVSDLDRCVSFYSRVLDFRKVSDREVAGDRYEHLFGLFGLRLRVVRMRLGREELEFMQFLTPGGRPIPLDSHSNDRWFQHVAIVVSDMDAAYARLRSYHVQYASSAPQRLPDWNPQAGGIQAFYFRDPDGHNLEVLAFPADKGAARWHVRNGALFLGIDHTAIVVTDSGASLRFYRDLLGFTVVGTSDNYGPEQEQLNNVFGARLHITSMRLKEGPGVEFLEYLAPRTGRAMPSDTEPDDLWYWQINMRATDLSTLEPQLRHAGVPLVSSSTTATPDRNLGFGAAIVVRDPDGHATLIAGGP
jgi:catechol 2,3-dioxygenase-like lactoylglutathione lyase family enzyme